MSVLTFLLASALVASCGAATRSRSWLETASYEHTQHRLGPARPDSAHPLPDEYSESDGLDANEAVAIAMWRSPQLQAELTNLDAALADVDEAGRPSNPRITFLAPLDPRQLALILAWPIEAIWQTPLRTEAANRELERVAESLVQLVLNTERDVRVAYAEARLARARREILGVLAASWQSSAELAESRVRAGESSLAETASIRAESTLASDAVARAEREQEIVDARLLMLLAMPWAEIPRLTGVESSAFEVSSEEAMVARAYRRRPDLRAAELAIHAAAARGNWERSRVFSLLASLDGQALRGSMDPNFSGGIAADLPIFSQNQSGIGRADAAVARATYLYSATRLTIAMEVTVARASTLRAQTSLLAYDSILSSLSEASAAARNAFEEGAEAYLQVVDALRRETDARLRRLELEAELARAEAELARAVGGTQSIGE